MIALADEFTAAVCSLTPQRIDVLRAAGIHERAIFHEPLLVGMAPIQVHKGGLYDVDAPVDADVDAMAREWAVLLPCGIHDGMNWQLEDIIAFKPREPGRWWRRLGNAQILGGYNIRPEPVFPLTVFETPLNWLRAGCDGVCVLDWAFDPECFFYAGPLEAESTTLKKRLQSRIKESALGKFEISVACSEVSNAA